MKCESQPYCYRNCQKTKGREAARSSNIPGYLLPYAHLFASFLLSCTIASWGQELTVVQVPFSRTSRPARAWRRKNSLPCFTPRRKATFAATSACSQRAAATVTEQRPL